MQLKTRLDHNCSSLAMRKTARLDSGKASDRKSNCQLNKKSNSKRLIISCQKASCPSSLTSASSGTRAITTTMTGKLKWRQAMTNWTFLSFPKKVGTTPPRSTLTRSTSIVASPMVSSPTRKAPEQYFRHPGQNYCRLRVSPMRNQSSTRWPSSRGRPLRPWSGTSWSEISN